MISLHNDLTNTVKQVIRSKVKNKELFTCFNLINFPFALPFGFFKAKNMDKVIFCYLQFCDVHNNNDHIIITR